MVAQGAGGPVAAAQAQQATALSPAGYAALDAVYVASLPLDGSPSAAERSELRRACDSLDPGDRLLAIMRTACLTSLQALTLSRAYARCSTPTGCLRATRSLRVLLSRRW